MPPRGNSVRAGGAFVDITARVSRQFRGALATVRRSLGRLSAGLSRASTRIATAAGAALLPVVALTKVFASLGDQIAKTAKRTGLSTEAISRLKFAAEQSGTSLEDVEKALKRQAKFLIDAEAGLATNVRAMKALGLASKDFADLSPEQSFALLSERLRLLTNDTERSARAQEVFGRAGTMLLPLIAEGAAGLEAYGKEAAELGVVLDTKTAKAAEDLTDGFNRIKTIVKGLAVAVGSTLAGDVKVLTARIVESVKAVRVWILNNREALRTFVAVSLKALALAAALKVVALVLGAVALLLTPGGLLLAGLAALVAFVPEVRNALKGLFGDALGIETEANKHLNFLEQIELAWNEVATVIQQASLAIVGAMAKMLEFLSKFNKVPELLGPFGLLLDKLGGEEAFAKLGEETEEAIKRLQLANQQRKITLRSTAVQRSREEEKRKARSGDAKKDIKKEESLESTSGRRRVRDTISQVGERIRGIRRERVRGRFVPTDPDEGRVSTRERVGLPQGMPSVLGTFSGRLARQVVGGQRVQRAQLSELKEQTKSLKAIKDAGNVSTFG